MERITLKDVKLANAIKVDQEAWYFHSDRYDIYLEDKFFVRVIHRTKKVEAVTTVYNMIYMHIDVVEKAAPLVKKAAVKKPALLKTKPMTVEA